LKLLFIMNMSVLPFRSLLWSGENAESDTGWYNTNYYAS
jgi:hypothetical protein